MSRATCAYNTPGWAMCLPTPINPHVAHNTETDKLVAFVGLSATVLKPVLLLLLLLLWSLLLLPV